MGRAKGSKLERSQIPSEVQEHTDDMAEIGEDMDEGSEDALTTAETLSSIEGGTSEGQDAEQKAIETGRDLALDHVTEKQADIEQVHEQSEQMEENMTDGRECGESDADKIAEAESRLRTDIAKDSLSEAVLEAQNDIELLSEYIEIENTERTASQQDVEEYLSRVEQAKGA